MKQSVQKRTEKVYKNAWTKSTKAHRFKNKRQTNPLLKTIVQYQRLCNCAWLLVITVTSKFIFMY